jgi:hypothetical protein
MTALIDIKGEKINRIETLIQKEKAKAEKQLKDSQERNSQKNKRY